MAYQFALSVHDDQRQLASIDLDISITDEILRDLGGMNQLDGREELVNLIIEDLLLHASPSRIRWLVDAVEKFTKEEKEERDRCDPSRSLQA